ncbi:hypothetical protein CR165_23100 [Pseudoroseomonas aestuarii]|uniref:Uncharacterized protein n=1 Tax=Teichococcus aestuarii TaxID=568898 RepID=A0A2U1UXT8_9PROT|nr:hypothetical protein CR165_23100 [Pseudoroseomonas aestuarii]
MLLENGYPRLRSDVGHAALAEHFAYPVRFERTLAAQKPVERDVSHRIAQPTPRARDSDASSPEPGLCLSKRAG